MRLRHCLQRTTVMITCCAAHGCTTAAEPADLIPSALVGTWVGDTLRHTPRGATAFTLEIDASGRFTWRVRTTGLYAGQAVHELSSSSREVGRLSTLGQRAIFRSDSVYVLNAVDRIESAERVDPASGGFGNARLFDAAAYRVEGDVLELSYLSYPADAPVATFRHFVRVK